MSLMEKAAPATPDTATPPAGEAPAAATPPSGDVTPTPVIQSSDWYYDENIKGNGERPEWLKEKYKTAADQAKAYVEVEKKLGAFKGAPDKYDLTLEGYPDVKFQDNDPLLEEFLESAKKNGVSQEYVTEVLGTYAKALTVNIPDTDAEMKKIGPNAAQDLQVLAQWAGNHLTPEEYKVFERQVTTADAFRVFDRLRQSMTQTDVPATAKSSAPAETVEQVRKLVSDPRYDTDPTFREEVRRRMSVAMANGGGKK
jgi:hypothetical protein